MIPGNLLISLHTILRNLEVSLCFDPISMLKSQRSIDNAVYCLQFHFLPLNYQ